MLCSCKHTITRDSSNASPVNEDTMKVEQTAEDEGKIIQQVNPGDSNPSAEIKQ